MALLVSLSLLYVTLSYQRSLPFVATRTSLSQVSCLNQRPHVDTTSNREIELDTNVDIQIGDELMFSSVDVPKTESSWYADKTAKGILSCTAAVVPGILATVFRQLPANAIGESVEMKSQGSMSSKRPLVYSVEMTDPPCLQPRTKKGEEGVAKRLSGADVVLMGEHYASNEDHQLQANIIERMIKSDVKKKSFTIGLEAVDFRFQKALDEYISASSGESLANADARLKADTNWDVVWKICPFDYYLPVFHLARERKIKLVALGLPGELKQRVKENGLDGLTDTEKSSSITDPQAFISFVKNPGFTRYTERIISPAFQKLKSRGILSEKVTQESYFGYRIYEDEAISTMIANYASRDTTFVALVGSGRTKFGYGIQERTIRILNTKYGIGTSPLPSTGSSSDGDKVDVVSMLLNPTASDSESPTVQLLLTLGYGPILKEQRPLSNYLWFSNSPPIKILTRPKNPISAEDEKPAGESSIIGAFGARG